MSPEIENPESFENRERPYTFGVSTVESETHPDRNEDAVLALPEHGSFAVIDGMGGHAAGDVAAQLALERLQSFIQESSPERHPETAYQIAGRALLEADRAIKRNQSAERREMGAAATIAIITKRDDKFRADIASTADSRAWVMRPESLLEQITVDNIDAYVPSEDRERRKAQQARLNTVENPDDIQPGDHMAFETRNAVRNPLGFMDEQPALYHVELNPSDILLLSTDGIHDNLTAMEIESILRQPGLMPKEKSDQLIQAAQSRSQMKHIRSKKDDMSAVVIEVRGE